MNDGKPKWKRIAYVGLIVIAFFAGIGHATHRFNKNLSFFSDMFEYPNDVRNAAHYAQLLLDSREGDTNAVIQRLEKCADMSLLMAYGSTNSMVKPFINAPWRQLKKDRADHPREYSTPKREIFINAMLDILIQEQSQFTNHPDRSSTGNPCHVAPGADALGQVVPCPLRATGNTEH